MGGTRFWTVKLPWAIFWLSYFFYASIANAITLAPIAVQSNLGQNLTVEIMALKLRR